MALAVRHAALAPNWNTWREKLYDEGMKLRQSEDEAIGIQSSGDHSPPISGPQLKTGWAGAAEIPASRKPSVHIRPGFDWKAADAYLFDIDGTLLNSRDAVHYHAFHHAVERVFGLDFRIDG